VPQVGEPAALLDARQHAALHDAQRLPDPGLGGTQLCLGGDAVITGRVTRSSGGKHIAADPVLEPDDIGVLEVERAGEALECPRVGGHQR